MAIDIENPGAAADALITALQELVGYKTETVAVSSAELHALDTSPVTLLPAPGAGLTYQFLSVIVIYTFGTEAYVWGNGPNVGYGPSGAGNRLIAGSPFYSVLTQTADTVCFFAPVTNEYFGRADFENQPILLEDTGGDDTTGATGTVQFQFTYRVIDLP